MAPSQTSEIPLSMSADLIDESPISMLSLPIEIRHNIYRMHFSNQVRSISYRRDRRFSLITEQSWPLLLTNRQIHAEALPIYYASVIFGVWELQLHQIESLLDNMIAINSPWVKHARNLLVWRSLSQMEGSTGTRIFDVLKGLKWVKVIGVTCGVEPDLENQQLFTYESLMSALQKAKVPGYQWKSSSELVTRPDLVERGINFMVDFRCDYLEKRISVDGFTQSRLRKTNFVWDVKEDVFVEAIAGNSKAEGMVLRPKTGEMLGQGVTRSGLWDYERYRRRTFQP